MKKNLLLSVAVVASMYSCHSGSKTDSSGTSSSSDNASSPASAMNSAASALSANSDEMQKHIEELKKLTPVSTDVLKSFFPDNVMGIKRSSFDLNSSMGYVLGNAEYTKDDTTKYTITLYDCAGDAGSALYGMNFLTRMNLQHEDDNGYTKSVDFMDSKSFEEYKKDENTYTESFVSAERFWVTLTGKNTGLDGLKDFAKAIDLDKLKDVK